MDFSDLFAAHFSGKGFASFNEFQAAFEAFQEQTGLQYIFKRTYHFPEYHPCRQTLVYKSLHYVCTERKPKYGCGCESFFTVGCRNSYLYVSKYNMLHNHEIIIRPPKPKPQPYSVIADYTNQFTSMFPTMVFKTFRQLEEKMEEFQAKTGCVYTKRHTCPWPKDDIEHRDLVYKKLAYECFHYGYKKDVANDKPDRRSFRTGCQSGLFVTCRNNALHITRFEMRHNHPVSGASGSPYRNKRRLTLEQQSVVKDMINKNENEITIKQFIQDTFDVCMTTVEVRNLKRKLRPKRASLQNSGFTLKRLENEGCAEFISNELGERHIVSFTTQIMKKTFDTFPEVLQIRYVSRPSLWTYEFAVIDRNLESRPVMYSFVLDCEFMGTLTPILGSLKNLMGQKWIDIETIFIDALPLNCTEVQTAFPLARILFYRDSVIANFKNSLKHPRFEKLNRAAIYDDFVGTLKAERREDYVAFLQRIDNHAPEFYQVLEETLLPFLDHWAEHSRLNALTFGITDRNSNYLRSLEYILPDSEVYLDESANALLEFATLSRGRDANATEFIDYRGQPEDIQSILRLLSDSVASVMLEYLQSGIPNHHDNLTVDPLTRSCSCSFYQQWRLPCIHLLDAARNEYIPLPSLLKDSRWLDRSPLEYGEESKYTIASIAGDETAMPSSSKYMKFEEQGESIQEMVVTSDEGKFSFDVGKVGESGLKEEEPIR